MYCFNEKIIGMQWVQRIEPEGIQQCALGIERELSPRILDPGNITFRSGREV
jgi:hypothetical protein